MAIWPMDSKWRVSQEFGTNPGGNNPPGGHTGTDIAANEGTPVYAMEDGVVTHADWGASLPGDDSAYGWAQRLYLKKESVGIGVVLKHASYYSTYSHLSRTDLALGSTVKRGQVIGYVGQTGLAFGAHLHWEVLPLSPNYANGVYGRVNPRLYITNSTTQTKTEASTMGYPYKLHTQWTSPNRSTRANFGHSGKPNSIVLHWWDTPARAGTFEGTVSWLCNPQSQVSAHYVVSGRNIACIVSPEEAAWHSGTTKFNGSSIGIEIDPNLPAGTMESVYQLCYELEQTYGSMLFYGHKDVNPGTACPGIIYNKIPEVINKVNALHKSGGKVATASTPSKQTSKPKPATTGSAWTATDNALVHDINGNKRTLRQVLSFRFDKYEKNIKTTEALAKRIAELEKKVK